jgi:hypothetical protein
MYTNLLGVLFCLSTSHLQSSTTSCHDTAFLDMATGDSDISSLILSLLWACYNVETYIARHFREVLGGHDHLAALFHAADFTFHAGLAHVLQSSSPPSLAWLDSLDSSVPKHVWGIYVLVYRKSGALPQVYVGSGTATNRGLRARVSEHHRSKASSHYITKAHQDGYRLTKSAVLATCPIPTSADAFARRTVVVAVEAVFACIFWPLRDPTKSYGLSEFCPWLPSLFEYGGLCSHSPLHEGIRGNSSSDLSKEELEEIAAAVKEHNRQYQVTYGKKLRAEASEKYKTREKRNNELQKPKTLARQQAAIANDTYHCDVCNLSVRDNASLTRHFGTPRHIAAATGQDQIDRRCELCNRDFKYPSDLKAHKNSPMHQRNLAA